MATYNWTATATPSGVLISPFDANNDVLLFDDNAISAAAITFTGGSNGGGPTTTFAFGGEEVTLQLDAASITTTNIQFSNGSLLVFGGNDVNNTTDIGPNTLNGGPGNDQLFGWEGNDQINAQGGNDLIDGSLGNDGIQAGTGNDSVRGGPGDDFITGDAGNDTIDGGDNGQFGDTVNYETATTGVNVDLVSGVATDGLGGTDTLFNVEHMRGSAFQDVLKGNFATNWFTPGAGNDTMDGRGGQDVVFYEQANGGVTINL